MNPSSLRILNLIETILPQAVHRRKPAQPASHLSPGTFLRCNTFRTMVSCTNIPIVVYVWFSFRCSTLEPDRWLWYLLIHLQLFLPALVSACIYGLRDTAPGGDSRLFQFFAPWQPCLKPQTDPMHTLVLWRKCVETNRRNNSASLLPKPKTPESLISAGFVGCCECRHPLGPGPGADGSLP